MKTTEPYAPEISMTPLQMRSAHSAYWAALPEEIRAILTHMMVWLRVYGPVLSGRISFRPMDIQAMTAAAQRRLHPDIERAAPGAALKARQISMITALYGFNTRTALSSVPVINRERLHRLGRTAARRFQQLCWAWNKVSSCSLGRDCARTASGLILGASSKPQKPP